MHLPQSELGIPMQTWLQNLRCDIYSILTSYKNVKIHRAKLACLCSELLAFHKNNINVPNKPVTPNENAMLRTLSTAISEMRSIFTSLNEQNYLKTLISTDGPTFISKLQGFRNTFNNNVLNLKFAQIEPCPIKNSQIRVDDMSDCQSIIESIDAILEVSANSLSEEEKTVLNQRKTECMEAIETYNREEADSKEQKEQLMRNVTPEEVTRELQEFKDYNVFVEDFQRQKPLGSGSFADVYLSYQKSTGKLVALKQLKVQQFKYNDFLMYKREISIFASLRHFAILSLVGASIQHPYAIATEFASNGNLFDRLHKPAIPFDATHKTICALGVAQGMAFMHSKGIVHRDLKSLNVLLDSDDFPKICDFGMSREMREDDVLTGGIGTYRWMAPEVLDSKKYNGKADVYSYGIVLWELLTHGIPFSNLNDYQVGVHVLQQKRPLIPQNCPTNLSKLIEKCWAQDPEKRPDFVTIAKAFECGGISFPGTNQEAVNAYINQFSTQQQMVGQIDPEKPSIQEIEIIISELSSENSLSLARAKLKLVADKPNWHPLFRNSQIIQAIISQMDNCNNAQLSFDLVQIFYSLSADQQMLNTFVENNGTAALLLIILKFGSTSMPKVIESLRAVLNVDHKTKLTHEHFGKLASFLGTTDMSIRVSSTKLICFALKIGAYTSDGALTSVINNVLSNAIVEAKQELLKPTLKLIKLLLGMPKPATHLARSDGPNLLLSLLPHPEISVVSDSLEILRGLFSSSPTTPSKAIQVYAQIFPSIIARGDNLITTKALYIFGVLIQNQSSFKEVGIAFEGFKECLYSQDPKILGYSLQLIYAYLSNSVSYPSYSPILIHLVPHLSSSHIGITAVAASCITVIIMNEQKCSTSDVLIDTTSGFLLNALKQSQLQSCALRLAGVISMTFAGAQFLDQQKVISQIQSLTNTEGEVKKLVFMTLASFSTSLPYSAHALEAIPSVFNAIDEENLSPYPLIFLSNVSSCTKGAIACVKYLSILSRLLNNDEDIIIEKTMAVIQNIYEQPSSNSLIQSVKDISDTLLSTKRLWDVPLFITDSLRIIEAAALFSLGKKALRESGILAEITNRIATLSLNTSSRKQFIRVIARTIE